MDGCTNEIRLNNFTINYTGTVAGGAALVGYACSWIECTKIWVYGNGTSSAYLAQYGTRMRLNNCEAYNVSFVMNAQNLSMIMCNTGKGLGTSYGLVAQWGGWVYANASTPGGTSARTYNDSGGGFTLGTATTDTGAAGTAPPAQTTTKWTSNVADNWSSSYSTWQGGGVKQGDYGYGQRKGLWWFESSPFAATLTGKTVKSARVWIQRASSGGSSGKTRHYLHPHTFATKAATPNNPSLTLETTYNVYVDLAWGEGAWVTIPSTWFAGFQSGSYKGIGLWAGSTSSAYYTIMNGQCTLEVTY
jgi:hypothetical protein